MYPYLEGMVMPRSVRACSAEDGSSVAKREALGRSDLTRVIAEEDAMQFKTGDTVKITTSHRSLMTVVEIVGGRLRCAWEDTDGNYREGIFDALCLEHCDEKKGLADAQN